MCSVIAFFQLSTLVSVNLSARSAHDLIFSDPSRRVSEELRAVEKRFEIKMLKNKNEPTRITEAKFVLYLSA